MRNRLFIFGCFPHDSQSILTGVNQLALVGVKSGVDRPFRFGLKLEVAALANADHRRVWSYDSQFALRHDFSLAHSAARQ
jgi:hypothetical protein